MRGTIEELSDLMELHFVELKMADEKLSAAELSEVEQWALYLRCAGRGEYAALVDELVKESEVIEVAEKLRREVSKDEELRARAFSRRLFQLDVKSNLNEAQRVGLRQGLEQGLEQGKWKERRLIAKNLLEKGMTQEFVCEATGLSAEEVERINNEE